MRRFQDHRRDYFFAERVRDRSSERLRPSRSAQAPFAGIVRGRRSRSRTRVQRREERSQIVAYACRTPTSSAQRRQSYRISGGRTGGVIEKVLVDDCCDGMRTRIEGRGVTKVVAEEAGRVAIANGSFSERLIED